MKVVKSWLQEYIKEPLPETSVLVEKLALHAFEVESVSQVGGEDVIEVDILPNRSHDCLGHMGIAREIATLFELTFQQPEIEVATDDSVSTADRIKLIVEDSKMTPRATKRLVTDVTIGESPDWLKNRLAALGQRSINNIVDITNFVMLECGQPVHAFDADKISGDITIRGAKAGEKVTTLDGDEYELMEGMLVIADEEKALDIAGVKGGNNSGIDDSTTNIILSVCNFDNVSVRRTSHALGLFTDAAKRFGNGLSPELPTYALARLSQLIHDVAGGRVAADILDEYPRRPQHYRIGFSTEETNALLGTTLHEDDILNILDRLLFSHEVIADPRAHAAAIASNYLGAPYQYDSSVIYDAPERFSCSSFTNFLYVHSGIALPSRSIDQFLGTDPIDESELSPGDLIFSKGDKPYTTDEVPDGIGHVGLYLGDGKVVHATGNGTDAVVVEEYATSPAFKELRGFRRVRVPSAPRIIATIPHERLDLRIKQDLIEEIGRVHGYMNINAQNFTDKHTPDTSKRYYYTAHIKDLLVGRGFNEIETYTFVEHGDIEVAYPLAKDKPFLRTTLRTTLHEALEKGLYYRDLLGESVIKVVEIGSVFPQSGEHLSLAFGATGVKSGKIDALIAETVTFLEEELGVTLHGNIVDGIFECNFSGLLSELPEVTNYDDIVIPDSSNTTFTPLSPFPFITRDIAFWTTNTDVETAEKLLREHAGDLLARIDLFDQFTKDDKTSYAFRLVFQAHDRTLSDDDVQPIMQTITETLANAGHEVR